MVCGKETIRELVSRKEVVEPQMDTSFAAVFTSIFGLLISTL
jgi:hypothetical protein